MLGTGEFFFFQAEDGIRDYKVTGVQTCALPISLAFVDTEVPLPHAQFMLAPKVEARLLQELDVRKHERVLEVGAEIGRASCRERGQSPVGGAEVERKRGRKGE